MSMYGGGVPWGKIHAERREREAREEYADFKSEVRETLRKAISFLNDPGGVAQAVEVLTEFRNRLAPKRSRRETD